MSERIPVSVNGKPRYDIVIEHSFKRLREELIRVGCAGRKCCIVTDDRVAGFYLAEIYDIVAETAGGAYMYTFPAGENSKTTATVGEIYESLIRQEFGRGDFLIALGGGVTGDLCGFAAATYLRGIRFIQIPTSLLSQVDSSIGGKTGVDFGSYKNMVGAFHMPELVYINITTLQSLPDRQFSSGMGEIIKHGLIADRAYYEMLISEREKIMKRDPLTCEQMVCRSAMIKRAVVEEDPSESGIRATLNFGHTIGHAIEKESGFRLFHGECVGLGMICALSISIERGLVPAAELERLTALLKFTGLPVHLKIDSPQELIADTHKDKKMDAGSIRFILLQEIGKAVIDRTVTEAEMLKSLENINE